MSILDSLQNQISGPAMAAIAGKLGVPPEQAQSAVATALPLLLGALGRNASQPQGAQDLHRALGEDHAGLDTDSVTQQAISGTNPGLGTSILGHIFGSQQPAASQGLGQATGLGSAGAQQLLGILAPIVMAHMGQQVSQGGMDATGLGQVLGQETQRIAQSSGHSLLSAVFDRDGDGKVGLSDLMKIGSGLLGGNRQN